jgi:diguanylate cyclase (GGDEF)-like protein
MSFLVDRYSSRLALNRPRAEFSDPQIEREFLLRFLPERNRQLRSSLLFTACFYLAFGVTDFAELGYTGAAWQLLALRILVALIALGGCSAIKRRPKSPYVSVAVACTVLVMALAVFMVLCWRQPGALAWNTMSQALILMATYIYFPNRLVYSVLIGTGSSVVFGFMLMFQRQLQWDDLLTLVLLLVMGNALGYFAASRIHISQRRQFRSALLLEQTADRDPLTSCYNRRFLQKGILEAELTRAYRDGTPLSVVMCDIDHFKRINDTFGHAAGDQVLVEFAVVMLSATRETVDHVIRYGGEEFLIILPQTNAAGAFATAHRIRQLFADVVSRTSSGDISSVTASFGIASVSILNGPQTISSEALIAAADEQLYAVKHNGRNSVCGTLLTSDAVL